MDQLARPIFIVAPPQSGATYLFEALGRSPDARVLGVRGRAALELAEDLGPSARGYDSNRRTAADATPDVAARLRAELRRLLERRIDDPGQRELRLVNATARHAPRPVPGRPLPGCRLRLPVSRAPGHAGEHGRGVGSPGLRHLSGASRLAGPALVVVAHPGWREPGGTAGGGDRRGAMADHDGSCSRTCRAAPERWCVADHAALAADPSSEVARICAFLELARDRLDELGDVASHTAIPSCARRDRANRAAPGDPPARDGPRRARPRPARRSGLAAPDADP